MQSPQSEAGMSPRHCGRCGPAHATWASSAATPCSWPRWIPRVTRRASHRGGCPSPEDCCYDNFSDTVEEDGVCSSDSSLFRRARDLYSGGADDEIMSQLSRWGCGLARGRGQSKENLRVEVRAASTFTGKFSGGGPVDSSSHEHYFVEQKFALGTPSAPPIAGDGEEAIFDTAEKKGGLERTGVSSVADILAEGVHELPTRSNVQEDGVHVPFVENNLLAQIPSFTTNVQNAWQSFVAYDACFRLCLNAWAGNCMEAPEFLHDECMVLRSAFGKKDTCSTSKTKASGNIIL